MKGDTRTGAGARRGQRPGAAGSRRDRSSASGPGKYGHGLPLTPQAEALVEAFLRLSGPDALALLLSLHEQGQGLDEIETNTLEPALTKMGELWLRGRIDDGRFEGFRALAENVERQFRLAVAMPGAPR